MPEKQKASISDYYIILDLDDGSYIKVILAKKNMKKKNSK